MKKLLGLSTVGSLFLANAASALADVNISPGTPTQGINPNANVSVVITNILTIIFMVSILLVLFFLIIGAFKWITSGGEKEKIKEARETIVNALIGLAILALAFLIVNIIGGILNINIHNLNLPSLDKGA
jgi:amino acid transporter